MQKDLAEVEAVCLPAAILRNGEVKYFHGLKGVFSEFCLFCVPGYPGKEGSLWSAAVSPWGPWCGSVVEILILHSCHRRLRGGKKKGKFLKYHLLD